MRPYLHATVSALLAVSACTGDITSGGGDDTGGGDDEPPVVCETGRNYVGFDGNAIELTRATLPAGADRLRIKPFGALATEYARVLGLATFDTSAFAATFGRPPPRWFTEPAASANTVYGAFALAFSACTQHTAAGAAYAAAPTTESADLTCRELANRAWNRKPSDAEVDACTTFTLTQTDPADDPRRRWAYSCAAVLSASGFLAY